MSESDRERRIRERAYHLWEAEGRPQGRDGAHWETACREEAAREAAVDAESAESFPASDPPSFTPLTGTGRG